MATGLTVTHAEAALENYGRLHWETVRQYAGRFQVSEELANLIYEAARQERIDPEVAFRLVRVESSFRTGVVGPAGAVGLSQIRPSTAQWLDPTVTRDHLFEAETNLRLGFRYLRLLLGNYRQDIRLALLAYNRGPGTVAALLALGHDPGNGYASRVLGIAPPPSFRIARVDSPTSSHPRQAQPEAPSDPTQADAVAPDDPTQAHREAHGDPTQADAAVLDGRAGRNPGRSRTGRDPDEAFGSGSEAVGPGRLVFLHGFQRLIDRLR